SDNALIRWRGQRRKEMINRVIVDLATYGRHLKNCFQLRCEQQLAADFGVVEWLDPQTIATEEKAPAARVPQRERKHAAQLIDEIGTVLLIQMHDDFRI